MFVFTKVGNIKNHFHFDRNIGKGSYGVVYLATNRQTLQKVAIKVIDKSNIENQETYLNEFKILTKIDHPNIVNIIEMWEWGHLYFIVMEYCAGGELYDYVIQKKIIDEPELYLIMN